MLSIDLKSPVPISLVDTVKSHGWVRLAPWKWDEDTSTLSRPERIEPHGLFVIAVTQSNPTKLLVGYVVAWPHG